MNSRRIIYTAFAVLFLVALGVFLAREDNTLFPSTHTDYTHAIQLNGTIVHVALADTSETRARGLSGRTGLESEEGMLFVFPKDGAYAFWMKDMQFSIDILWLSSDGRIMYIVPNLSPDTYPKNYVSKTPARYVLELPAGYVEGHGVRIGDIAQIGI